MKPRIASNTGKISFFERLHRIKEIENGKRWNGVGDEEIKVRPLPDYRKPKPVAAKAKPIKKLEIHPFEPTPFRPFNRNEWF